MISRPSLPRLTCITASARRIFSTRRPHRKNKSSRGPDDLEFVAARRAVLKLEWVQRNDGAEQMGTQVKLVHYSIAIE